MRVVSYNPLTRKLRAEEISHKLDRTEVAALQGTVVRWQHGADVTRLSPPHHDALHWGWGRGVYSNKACGVSSNH